LTEHRWSVWMGSHSTFVLPCHCFVISVIASLSVWKGRTWFNTVSLSSS